MFFWFFCKKLQISQKDSKSIGRGKGKSRFCLVLHENYKFQDFVKQKTEFRAKTFEYRKGPDFLFFFWIFCKTLQICIKPPETTNFKISSTKQNFAPKHTSTGRVQNCFFFVFWQKLQIFRKPPDFLKILQKYRHG